MRAGHDTTARLLSGCLRVLAERPDLQHRLRNDRQLIPDFIEEALRLEGRVKCSPKSREHLAFGRGAHTCAGSPLVRGEVRINFERLLDIRIAEERHGAAGDHRLTYEPSYILCGVTQLHLQFTPNTDAAVRRAS